MSKEPWDELYGPNPNENDLDALERDLFTDADPRDVLAGRNFSGVMMDKNLPAEQRAHVLEAVLVLTVAHMPGQRVKLLCYSDIERKVLVGRGLLVRAMPDGSLMLGIGDPKKLPK